MSFKTIAVGLMVLSDGVVHFLKIEKKKNLPKLSCGFNFVKRDILVSALIKYGISISLTPTERRDHFLSIFSHWFSGIITNNNLFIA